MGIKIKNSVISEISVVKFHYSGSLLFFKNIVTSSFKATYALEMGAHWFEKNGVRVGDKLKVVE